MLDTWHAAGCTSRAKNANKKPRRGGGEFGQALAWALWLTLGPISYAIGHGRLKVCVESECYACGCNIYNDFHLTSPSRFRRSSLARMALAPLRQRKTLRCLASCHETRLRPCRPTIRLALHGWNESLASLRDVLGRRPKGHCSRHGCGHGLRRVHRRSRGCRISFFMSFILGL